MATMHAAPQQFVAAVEFAGFTYRGLAEEVTTILRKDRKRPLLKCSHTTISNLAAGTPPRTHARRAAAIEKALKLPPGHLFRIEAFSVPGERRASAA